jgi:hypothetical protein
MFFSGHPAVAALVLFQNTFENTSGIVPDDFQYTTTNNPIVKMEVYNRRANGIVGAKISTDPAAGTYPVAANTPLDLSIKMPALSKVYVQVIAEEGTRYDATKTFFTFGGAAVRTAALTLAPDLINLGGNNWQVTLTNVNDAPVTISSLVYGFDDPGNPYGGGYVPGGTLVPIIPPTTPLLPGQMLTEDFTASPNFTVSFSDIVALSSAPSDQFLDVVAVRIPEPSTWAMMLVGFVSLGLARYRRAISRGATAPATA